MPESLMMLRTAVVLLALTAGGGLLIAGLRFAHHPRPPHWLAMLHGLMAGAALTLLLYAGFTSGLPGGAWAGLAVLLLATVGGLVLNLRYHVHDKPLPTGLMLAHGAIAAVGLVLLALAAWGS